MSFSHSILSQFSRPGETLGQSLTETGNAEIARDAAVADSVTDAVMDVDFVHSDLQSIFLLSDQAVTADFVRASDSAEFVTVVLTASVPYTYQTSGYASNPFNAAVSKLHITNASGSTANVQLRVLVN